MRQSSRQGKVKRGKEGQKRVERDGDQKPSLWRETGVEKGGGLASKSGKGQTTGKEPVND